MKLAGVLGIPAFIASAVPAVASPQAEAAAVLTERDGGSTISLHPGEIVEVRLAAQLGTGFSWQRADRSAALAQRGPMSIGRSHSPGGIETQVFHFRATSTGRATLAFQCRRPWRGGAVGRSVEFTILVR